MTEKKARPFISVRERAPELVGEWDQEANKDLTPDNVSYGSGKKIKWRCRKCGNLFEASPRNRILNSTNCPFCSNRKIIPGWNSLAALYPDMAEEWHPERNGRLSPDELAPKSRKIVWWHCEEGHSWAASIANRVINKSRCPVCHGVKDLTRLI